MLKALYLRTAKTGSSTIVNWGRGRFEITSNLIKIDSPENKILIENYFKQNLFLFYSVRNPYERAVSSWAQCINAGWRDKNFTFENFLDLDFSTLDNVHMLTHVQPITEYLGPWIDKVDFIIRLENLISNLKELAEKLQFPYEYPIPQYRGDYNRSKDYFTTENKKKIENKFKADFEFFGY